MLNVLSLFDGISCARLALEKNQITINKYFASEIDKESIKVAQAHFPDTIFLGDIKQITKESLGGLEIDLLIGGSPCQDLSGAQAGQGLLGAKSSLFYEYVRLLEELKPKYFLLENVSMKKEWKEVFDKTLQTVGIEINSNLFSAQSRPRCYWTNIPHAPFPTTPSSQNIQDILDTDNPNIDKYHLKSQDVSNFLTDYVYDEQHALAIKNPSSGISRLFSLPKEILKDNERQRRIYSIVGKSPTLLARTDTTKILVNQKIRKLTPLECERLQTIPDNYTAMSSDAKRYKLVGNAFTVDVIGHFLNYLASK